MKILVVSNLFPPCQEGGYEVQCAQMVRQLRMRGHSVHVLTAAPAIPLIAADPVDSDVTRTMQSSHYLRRRRMMHAGQLTQVLAEVATNFVCPENVYSLLREIDELEPDVAYLWNLVGLGGLGLVSGLAYRGLPWVWHLEDAVPRFLCQLRGRLLPHLVQVSQPVMRGTWLVCSTRLVAEIERAGPRLDGKVDFIPAWIDEPRLPPVASPHVPGEPLRVVYSGVMATFKGTEILLDALGQLHAEGHRVTLDLIGPVQEPRLQDVVNAASLHEAVTFHGPLPHDAVLQMLPRSHVFAFPTHEREPFGVAPLEAAARGVVPVLSESCGISEWLVDRLHCLKAPRSPDQFANVLRQIMTGEIDLTPIARRARVAALRDFSIARWVPKVEQALADAAATSAGLSGRTASGHRAALMFEQIVNVTLEEMMAA